MENLLESNERTLVMFDAVCSGLASCLALVHSDIKQMTEHRNKLALLEQQQIQAKLIPAHELIVVTNNNNNNTSDTAKGQLHNNNNNEDANGKNGRKGIADEDEADPHHLAGLKLLDKRLADSFSQALNLSDLQKSSLAAKHQSNQNKTSIFHVLLGKGKSNSTSDKSKGDSKKASVPEPLDNKTIIDDINRQTRLAMQYSKQLESHLFKVEDLRSKYEMHLKMGLVVKSVSRAYLTNGSTNCSPATLNRRHHCSSLVINDSSSIGTHSSMSSLNLSTWSSSRSKEKRRQAAGLVTQHSTPNGANHQQLAASPSVKHNESRLNQNGCRNSMGSDMFISTLSLSNAKHKRANFGKMISPSSPNCLNQFAYGDWPPTETANYGANYMNGNSNDHETSTLSKSHYNLNASQTSLKNSKSKKHQLASSKTTIKEFIENIDKIESEFESYMGSFLLAIEDIQGFARVCQGDVFEISIKYGDAQKFKTKISVLKENRQKCDHRQSVFKARIADVLAIKAYECKGLGKRVLLGHKLCETRDLFTARSQLMTLSLNNTGSIKLNLIVTWNPLHLSPAAPASPDTDITHVSMPTCLSTSSISSMYSVPSIHNTGNTTTIKIRSNRKMTTSSPDIGHQQQDPLYQTLVDPIYGVCNIPPPDYLSNEQNNR